MNFNNPYWLIETKIQMLERWILVHSYIYYELDQNVVSDAQYDGNARQLLDMLKSNRSASSASKYAYAFKEFEGSGFDLFTKLNKCDMIEIRQDAERTLKLHQK